MLKGEAGQKSVVSSQLAVFGRAEGLRRKRQRIARLGSYFRLCGPRKTAFICVPVSVLPLSGSGGGGRGGGAVRETAGRAWRARGRR